MHSTRSVAGEPLTPGQYPKGTVDPIKTSTRRRRSGWGSGGGADKTLDADSLPRPVGPVQALHSPRGKVYRTDDLGGAPPVCGPRFAAKDRGSASCRVLRPSVATFPTFQSVAGASKLPIALVCSPLAGEAWEEGVPQIDYGEEGPVRCPRCKAYVNGFFAFGPDNAECSICEYKFPLPEWYHCPVTRQGRREDNSKRMELVRGTVDYVAPEDYGEHTTRVTGPNPAMYFVLDASYVAVQSGAFQRAVHILHELLVSETFPHVGLLVHDGALRFFEFEHESAVREEARRLPRMHVVGDLSEPFTPVPPTALFADPGMPYYAGQLEALLAFLLSERFLAEVASGDGCVHAALDASIGVLEARNGSGVIMSVFASEPRSGVASLPENPPPSVLSDASKKDESLVPDDTVLHPAKSIAGWFKDKIGECLRDGICVESFYCAPPHVHPDIASLSHLSRQTGGSFRYYPSFSDDRDAEALAGELRRAVTVKRGFRCSFRLRCSKGLEVEECIGPWSSDLGAESKQALASFSADKSFIFNLRYDGCLGGDRDPESTYDRPQVTAAYLQLAFIYTSFSGERLVRVCTLSRPVGGTMLTVFKSADLEVITMLLLRQAALLALSKNKNPRKLLVDRCAEIMHSYRYHCASSSHRSTLALPNNLHCLPLFVHAMFKSSAQAVRAEARMGQLVSLLDLPLARLMPLLYPRVYELHSMVSPMGEPTEVADNIFMPQRVAASVRSVQTDGVYLVESGRVMYLYFGSFCHERHLVDILGVPSLDGITSPQQLPPFDRSRSDLCEKICRVMEQVGRDYAPLPLSRRLVLPRTQDEASLFALLTEDKMAGEMGYSDFIYHLHHLIIGRMDP